MTATDESRRTRLLAGLGLFVLALGALFAWRWPSSAPALSCPPEQVRWVDAGTSLVAVCGPGALDAPAALRLTVGQRLELNRATEAELTLVPGVGPKLAHTLIEARDRKGGFASWEEVDAVVGVGPGKLEAIRSLTVLGTFEGPDGGVL